MPPGSAASRDPEPQWPTGRRPRGRRLLSAAGLGLVLALAGYAVAVLMYPAPLVSRDRRIPLVIGMPADDARAVLDRSGFRAKVSAERESDPLLPAGWVTWQDPPAHLEAPAGSLVELTLSGGPAPAVVPDVLLFDLDLARHVLAAAGLAVGAIDSVPAEPPPGVVVATRPTAGTPRPSGAAVDLVVSRGPAAVRVPSLLGLPEAEARQRLETLGLRVGLVRQQRGTSGRGGMVLEQRPRPGVLLPRGGRVNLTVAEAGAP